MDYRTKEKKLKQLLNFIYDGTTVTSDLLELSQQEFASLLESATKSGYIRGASITKTKMYPIIWTDDVELTEEGAEKIHPSEKIVNRFRRQIPLILTLQVTIEERHSETIIPLQTIGIILLMN